MSIATLAAFRAELVRRGLQAAVVTSADPHNSEYVADVFKRRERLCGFGGSSGTCVVTPTQALLWTDGRYWLEAQKSLFPGWELMKDHPADPSNVSVEMFLRKAARDAVASVAACGSSNTNSFTVGVDGHTVTRSWWTKVLGQIQSADAGARLVATETNLVDSVIGGGIPATPPEHPVVVHPDEFAGESVPSKLRRLCDLLARSDSASMTVLTALDDVAWLLNLRGSDVPYCPVFYAYAIVDASMCTTASASSTEPPPLPVVHLFVDDKKLTTAVRAHLASFGAVVHPYNAIVTVLRSFVPAAAASNASYRATCSLNDLGMPHSIVAAVEENTAHIRVLSGCKSHVQWMKAEKNAVELQGFRNCHVRDGIALTRLLAWLTATVENAKEAETTTITEVDVSDKVDALRREVSPDTYRGPSFETIAGFAANGAIIHYRPHSVVPSTPVGKRGLFLLDSGGQYVDGTTDVTRTISLGAPTDEEREAYTAVLKGHIALNAAVFPPGTTGHRIDCLARLALWNLGLDYAHGTGHGVGSFLNVHEGPHGIGMSPNPTGAALKQTMIVSNEPGFYKDGQFGIRIENLDEIVAAPECKHRPLNAAAVAAGGAAGSSSSQPAPPPFLTLQSITMAPLCVDLIDWGALSPSERQWVNDYHRKVRAALINGMTTDGERQYLLKHTEPR